MLALGVSSDVSLGFACIINSRFRASIDGASCCEPPAGREASRGSAEPGAMLHLLSITCRPGDQTDCGPVPLAKP